MCVCVCVYVYIYIYIYIYIYSCVCVYVFARVCICVTYCECVCMRVYVYVYVYVYIGTRDEYRRHSIFSTRRITLCMHIHTHLTNMIVGKCAILKSTKSALRSASSCMCTYACIHEICTHVRMYTSASLDVLCAKHLDSLNVICIYIYIYIYTYIYM
jgi:hypothetical protein